VLFRDGVPIATSVGGIFEMLVPGDDRVARDALRHGPAWRALIGDADTAIA